MGSATPPGRCPTRSSRQIHSAKSRRPSNGLTSKPRRAARTWRAPLAGDVDGELATWSNGWPVSRAASRRTTCAGRDWSCSPPTMASPRPGSPPVRPDRRTSRLRMSLPAPTHTAASPNSPVPGCGWWMLGCANPFAGVETRVAPRGTGRIDRERRAHPSTRLQRPSGRGRRWRTRRSTAVPTCSLSAALGVGGSTAAATVIRCSPEWSRRKSSAAEAESTTRPGCARCSRRARCAMARLASPAGSARACSPACGGARPGRAHRVPASRGQPPHSGRPRRCGRPGGGARRPRGVAPRNALVDGRPGHLRPWIRRRAAAPRPPSDPRSTAFGVATGSGPWSRYRCSGPRCALRAATPPVTWAGFALRARAPARTEAWSPGHRSGGRARPASTSSPGATPAAGVDQSQPDALFERRGERPAGDLADRRRRRRRAPHVRPRDAPVQRVMPHSARPGRFPSRPEARPAPELRLLPPDRPGQPGLDR